VLNSAARALVAQDFRLNETGSMPVIAGRC
jgi:hypothetical protein